MIKLITIPYKGLKWLAESVYEAGEWLTIGTYRLLFKTLKYLKMAAIIGVTSFLVSYMCWKIWDYNLTQRKEIPAAPASKELLEIYHNVARVTEVTNRIPPFGMWESMESYLSVNAFTTGEGIYFTYLADRALTEDEKALVMGHEMAHVILHHTDNEFGMFVNSYSSENELMADNVGASWADKAGYDVCKGREVYMKFYAWGGNSLNASHPPNTIRYENLAHYCKGKK